MKDLEKRITNLKQVMGQLAENICSKNPDYRDLSGQLTVLLEIQALRISET